MLPMPPQSDADARVLASLREMDEHALHTDIIHPLLQAMGAHHVQYTHGSYERGKDFLFLMPSSFGTTELVVSQVKNGKLSGQASNLSKSTTAFLHQAIQCKDTAVLHPTTNARQTPDRVVLFSTYPLPDAPLADANTLLSKVRSACTILGPDDLLSLLNRHLPAKYSTIAFPGNSAALAIQRYVLQHREADAFELSTQRTLDSLYVNIGVSCEDSLVGGLLSGKLEPAATGTLSISEADFVSLWRMQRQLPCALGGQPWVDVGKSAGNAATILSCRPSDKATVVDPDERIRGCGVLRLQDAGIEVDFFPDRFYRQGNTSAV